MNFNTWGPFEFDNRREGQWKRTFWEQAAQMESSYGLEPDQLRSAIGCYLFATRRGENYTPWYVGKTLGASGFEGEIFQPHKLDHYEAALDGNKRRGYIFLFALITDAEHWKFSKGQMTSRRTIDWLEKTMIGMALAKNFELRNMKDTKLLREVWVEGIFGSQRSGMPSKTAREARKVLLP